MIFVFAFLVFEYIPKTISQFIVATINIFSMPSTRKQKANEKRSRQLDLMSDVKNDGITHNVRGLL